MSLTSLTSSTAYIPSTYHSTIHCFNAGDRQEVIDNIKSSFPSMQIKTVPANPKGIHIYSNHSSDTGNHDQCLGQYENNPSKYGIIYREGHPKHCIIKPRPNFKVKSGSNISNKPQAKNSSNSSLNFVPGYPGTTGSYASAMATFYNYPVYDAATSPITPTMGITSFGGNYMQSDLNTYWSLNPGQSPTNPNIISYPILGYTPPAYGTDPDADTENTLDLELTGGTCNNATIYIYSNGSIVNIYYMVEQAITNNVNVLSCSWGAYESDWNTASPTLMSVINSQFQTAVESGMTITVATGDYGCFPNTASTFQVQFPAVSPWVVSCGGTSLAGTVEDVWNDNPSSNPTVDAGGGGQSDFPSSNPLPAYQASLVIPNPIYPLAPSRYIPDIAMDADPDSGWVLIATNGPPLVGGTSAVAPFMAGLVARMLALSRPGSIPRIGYSPLGLNTYLYQAPYSSCFNDITIGNIGPVGTIQTQALVGYDLSSGLGSIQGNNLFNFLNNYTCVTLGTRILMADGTLKEIQDIVPGDKVSGKCDIGKENKYECICKCCKYYTNLQKVKDISWGFTVVKVLAQLVSPESTLDLLVFEPGCIGEGIPERKLTITQGHPLFYNDMHIYAKYFRDSKGVTIYDQVPARECIPVSGDGNYYLYDLQFSHEGAYTAEGVVIQSRSPDSKLTPLG